jgi:hypothetical protein
MNSTTTTKTKFTPIAASTKDFFSTDLLPIQNPRQCAIPHWRYKELNVDTFLSKLFTKENIDPQVFKQTTLVIWKFFPIDYSFSQMDQKTPRETLVLLLPSTN